MKKKILFIDMDGTIADFAAGVGREVGIEEKPKECLEKGFYRNLPVIEGAQEGISELEKYFDVYIATKPKKENPYCLEEKMEWIREHFPSLSKKVFFTPDKRLLKGDILIDDHERWKGFDGLFILFKKGSLSWSDIQDELISSNS